MSCRVDEEFLAKAERVMAQCQRGTGGRHALENAHAIMADAYGTIGRMVAFFRQNPEHMTTEIRR